jgi:hypothetical protein
MNAQACAPANGRTSCDFLGLYSADARRKFGWLRAKKQLTFVCNCLRGCVHAAVSLSGRRTSHAKEDENNAFSEHGRANLDMLAG